MQNGGAEDQNFVSSYISRLVERAALGRDPKRSTIIIVESVLWPFIVSRAFSSKRTQWYDKVEMPRLLRSVVHMIDQIDKQAQHPENRDQSFVKYWLDLAMCQVVQDEAGSPPKPDYVDAPLFVGCLKRALRLWVARGDVSRVYSLSKGSKKLWPVLGESKKAATLEKHRARFAEPVGTSLPEELRLQIRYLSRKIFVGDDPLPNGLKFPATKFNPSLSACLQSSRSRGGAAILFSAFEPTERKPDLVSRSRLLNLDYEHWRNAEWQAAVRNVASRVNDPTLHTMKVVSIPEPSKFRIITKMDGYLATALQPLQGAMLSAWKATRYSTMLHDDCTQLVNSVHKMNKGDEFFCSVDYESATDLLWRAATWAALEPMFEDSVFGPLAWLSFRSGKIIYPGGVAIESEERQPMGHPLSFPLLCVANLAVYQWTALQEALSRFPRVSGTLKSMRRQRRNRGLYIKHRLHAVIVNGDDMLFKCDRVFYDRFIRNAKSAGLHISVGKNYLSKTFCQINSQIFVLSDGVLVRRDYLNLKFVSGSSVKLGESAATPTQIGVALQKMIGRAPWTRAVVPDVFGRWRTWQYLYRGFTPNWYLPLHLGGFGLRPSSDSIRITREQRMVAAVFLAFPQLTLTLTGQSAIRSLRKLREVMMLKSDVMLVREFNVPLVVRSGFVPVLDLGGQTDWEARLLLFARAMDPAAFIASDIIPRSRLLSREQIHTYFRRVKRMSIDDINEWRDAVVCVRAAVAPPPLLPVKLRPVLADFQLLANPEQRLHYLVQTLPWSFGGE